MSSENEQKKQADQQAAQPATKRPVIKICTGCGCSFEDKNGQFYDGIDRDHCSMNCYDNTR